MFAGRRHPVTTELLFAMLTLIAVHTTIHHAANGNMIAWMKFFDVLPHGRDDTHNFVARDQRVRLRAPVSVDRMQI